ncbi:hypothetical protein [Salinibacter ruber]|uniref:Uncharacterized protein n=1 Tax=Salinibacter ruber TaxID=146919 RepID=A0AAW5P8E1_9BACT|nr:hypothetical protein [Salinibacter ruber]MCS4157719.1 hypothetical protein [Salinibacter ruber]
MINSIGAVRRQFEAAARRYDERADAASTAALREYYRGRADEARASASAVQRLEAAEQELDPTDVIESHSTNQDS